MVRITESNYIALMKKGSQNALKYFIEQHGWRIKAIVQKKLNQFPNEQEDCMNEIFYAIWSNVKKYDPEKGTFNTWIAAVSKYVILNYFRKLKNTFFEEPLEQENFGNDTGMFDTINSLENEGFEELISCLPEKDRKLFRMLYLQEKSSLEICRSTGMKKENVYNRVSRGKRKIKLFLKEDSNYEGYF